MTLRLPNPLHSPGANLRSGQRLEARTPVSGAVSAATTVLTFNKTRFISIQVASKMRVAIVLRSVFLFLFLFSLLLFGIPYGSQPARQYKTLLYNRLAHDESPKGFGRTAGPIRPSRVDGRISNRVKSSVSEWRGNRVQLHSLRGLWRASPHGTTGSVVAACLRTHLYAAPSNHLSDRRKIFEKSFARLFAAPHNASRTPAAPTRHAARARVDDAPQGPVRHAEAFAMRGRLVAPTNSPNALRTA